MLSAKNLEDLPQYVKSSRTEPGYSVSRKALTQIAFAVDGFYMAVADADYGITLFRNCKVLIPKSNGSTETTEIKQDSIVVCK